MGEPLFSPDKLPASSALLSLPKIIDHKISVNDQEIQISCVSMGNPHAVAFIEDDVDNFPLDTERGYHVLFDTDQKLINRPIAWSESVFYLIQIEDGIRAAGTVEIAGLNKPPNDKRTKMIERQTRKILPQLKEVKSTWLGFRPTLHDSLPVNRSSQKKKNIIY